MTKTVATTATPAATGACNAAAFEASYCPFGDYSWCLLNHTNGAYEDTNVGRYTEGYLCMKSGDATWEIENGDGGHRGQRNRSSAIVELIAT